MQEKRYFTLEEANQCIPQLVDEISQLRAIRNLTRRTSCRNYTSS